MKRPPCTFAGCGRPECARGLCEAHYRQQLAGKPLRPIQEKRLNLSVALRRVRAAAAILPVTRQSETRLLKACLKARKVWKRQQQIRREAATGGDQP